MLEVIRRLLFSRPIDVVKHLVAVQLGFSDRRTSNILTHGCTVVQSQTSLRSSFWTRLPSRRAASIAKQSANLDADLTRAFQWIVYLRCDRRVVWPLRHTNSWQDQCNSGWVSTCTQSNSVASTTSDLVERKSPDNHSCYLLLVEIVFVFSLSISSYF